MKVAIVTGVSSGIGYEVSKLLLKEEYKVYGLSRRGTAPKGVIGISTDVSDEFSLNSAIKNIIDENGRVDLLISNAGMGISGPVEFADSKDVERIMNVNFMGGFYAAKAVLETMRKQHSGRIVFTSSVAAEVSIPYQVFYSASKASLTMLAMGLRNELKEFGITVSCVEPGDAKTGFTDARKKEEAYNSIYVHNQSATASMEKDERNGMSAMAVAKVILKACTKKNPKPVYTAGGVYKIFSILIRILPRRFCYWLVGKIYG